jgi:lipopolysaccharide/colanic/teichoic acid biosynthesis glycosyltransferase
LIRRSFDIIVASLALVATSPLLAAALVAIVLESRGHPIYRQRRIGLDGRPFDVIKLRTMVLGAESMGARMAVNENDPRITRVGALLRRFSVDELPNLINVLGRLSVRPGITGWAQVNGRTSLPWSERIELDLFYVEHRSWRLDLEIILRTARILVTGHGLYKGETGGWTG